MCIDNYILIVSCFLLFGLNCYLYTLLGKKEKTLRDKDKHIKMVEDFLIKIQKCRGGN